MPVYELGASESGSYRIILPPDPRPPSKVGKFIAYALAFAIGLVSGGLICTLIDDKASGSQGVKASVGPTSPQQR